MRDFCSRSESLRSRSAIVTGERMFAWSTTLPVSGGKLAAASAALAHSAARSATSSACGQTNDACGQRRGMRALPWAGLELHFGRRLGLGIGGERNQRLDRAEHRLRPEHARESPQRGVEVLHRGDVIAPGDSNAVLGPLELGLQRKEI